MIDKHPGLFVMCGKWHRMFIAAVNFGRENNL